MSANVKCMYCSLMEKKEKMIKADNGRYYHASCYDIVIQKQELYKYICKLFNFQSPGPVIYKQLNLFFKNNPNYTYKGILQALRYFYEVKRGSKEKANGGIGIVPYVYNEAQEYFNNVALKQKRVATEISSSLESSHSIEIKVKEKPKKETKLYDIEDFC